ncbi:hypothetical protein HL658_21575 [Azospirillum sp. RWY-5-1]|uniref:Uncharacterized protein n=1 Tax=Azospirillum oleiclasticum TaxID=2735135 RepID=A0ABX2TF58_9PROT|nr:hypothetical protein [Azospirillum oleiclasticum]NYZ15140.1 hypothetical protein [Azospirillum oleiclasticum]NYZ22903.1 hypothetical protein [Azospirillum oleiclasticum]
MENLTVLFSCFAILLLMMVWAALRWSRSGKARALIIALFALMLPAAYAAPATLLGRAKPVTLEWIGTHVQEAQVLSATLIENDAIYLTLMWREAPNLYQLPWDRRMAEQLQEAMKDAERNGTRPVMRLPFEKSWDDREPRFYAQPQPKMPDKPMPGGGVEFQHPGQAT